MTVWVPTRNGVKAARMPGVTAQQPLQCKPRAACDAKTTDGLVGILGTAGIKAAARAEKRTHRPLIQPDQELCHEPHFVLTSCHKGSSCARSSALAAPRARCRALTTRSSAGIS